MTICSVGMRLGHPTSKPWERCELGQPDPFSRPLRASYIQHSLLHPHRNRASGLTTLPDETTCQAIEKFKLRACEGQLALLDILEEDLTIPETTARYFLLCKMLKYMYRSALLRSCHASGFLYFDQMPCPKRNIPKAKECLSSLRRSRHVMTARSRVEYYCIKCDNCIRLAKFETTYFNMLRYRLPVTPVVKLALPAAASRSSGN